jgi:hypothetical protein
MVCHAGNQGASTFREQTFVERPIGQSSPVAKGIGHVRGGVTDKIVGLDGPVLNTGENYSVWKMVQTTNFRWAFGP